MLYIVGCKCVDTLEQVGDVLFPTIVQKTLAEVKGEALTIVAGYSQLSLNLPFGGIELVGGERFVYHALQFLFHEFQASLDIVRVATEICAPYPRVAIAHHRALHGIYKSVALAERQIQSGVHTRSAYYII